MIRFHWIGCALVGAFVGCAPVRENHRMDPRRAANNSPEPTLVPEVSGGTTVAARLSTDFLPPGSETPRPPQKQRATFNGRGTTFTMTGLIFDSRTYRLEIADQAGGPGSQWPDSQAAGIANGGVGAVNAGFFTPEGAPLGLVVSHGNIRGSWNSKSSLGSAVWYEDRKGHSGIARREAIGSGAERGMQELLQAGPLLLERGTAVAGLDATKSSPRTILMWDGGTRWMIAHVDACSLAELAKALAGFSGTGNFKTALNLDGGRSAELWMSDKIPGGNSLTRPFWNKPVRNFLVLKPRS